MAGQTPRESSSSVGGIVERTHQVGFNQLSKSHSPRAPAERVLSVDAVMDAAPAILWPEIGSNKPSESEGDATRAQAKKPSRGLESGALDKEEDGG